MPTILVADDDHKITELLRRALMYEGYSVLIAADGRDALAQALAQRPDLVVLDWTMPGLDGVAVARSLRAAEGRPTGTGVPILMLTARDTVEDRVAGLDAGADDYLVKPFALAELLARVRSLLRRATPDVGVVRNEVGNKPLRYADLALDQLARETRRGARVIALSPKEFDLLSYLLGHPEQVLPRERILREVWSSRAGDVDGVLDVYIGYLRAKTEAGGEPRLIQTVRGVGYVLREE